MILDLFKYGYESNLNSKFSLQLASKLNELRWLNFEYWMFRAKRKCLKAKKNHGIKDLFIEKQNCESDCNWIKNYQMDWYLNDWINSLNIIFSAWALCKSNWNMQSMRWNRTLQRIFPRNIPDIYLKDLV